MFILHRVKKAEYLSDYKILLTFEDKKKKIVDFEKALDGFEGEIFQPLKDIKYFRKFQVAMHTVIWPNEADVAPEYLYDIGALTVSLELDQTCLYMLKYINLMLTGSKKKTCKDRKKC